MFCLWAALTWNVRGVKEAQVISLSLQQQYQKCGLRTNKFFNSLCISLPFIHLRIWKCCKVSSNFLQVPDSQVTVWLWTMDMVKLKTDGWSSFTPPGSRVICRHPNSNTKLYEIPVFLTNLQQKQSLTSDNKSNTQSISNKASITHDLDITLYIYWYFYSFFSIQHCCAKSLQSYLTLCKPHGL